MKMKKYNVVKSLNKYKQKLNQMVLEKSLTDKSVIKLSKKIDILQNKLEQV